MFESKEEIMSAVDAVYTIAADLNRGDVLTHDAIQSVLGIRPHEGQWGYIVDKVRRRLEKERGIATWPSVNVGYRLLTAEETLTDLPILRLKKGRRQATRAKRSVQALPEKGLSLHQRRARVFVIERTREAERAIRQEIKAQSEPITPTQVMPRRVANSR